MRKPSKYCVVIELPSTGYMDCVAICDNAYEAYGRAMIAMCDGLDRDESDIRRLTLPDYREGENGMVMSLENTATGETEQIATVLFYREDTEDADN